jgi:hypothetical protein
MTSGFKRSLECCSRVFMDSAADDQGNSGVFAVIRSGPVRFFPVGIRNALRRLRSCLLLTARVFAPRTTIEEAGDVPVSSLK